MFSRARHAVAATLLIAACGSPPVVVFPGQDAGVIGFPDAGGPPPPPPPDGGVPPPVPPLQDVYLGGYAYRLDSYLAESPLPLAGASVQALGVIGATPQTTGASGEWLIRVPQNGAVLMYGSQLQYWPSYENIPIANRSIVGIPLLVAYGENIRAMAERFLVDAYNQEIPCHAPNVGAACRYGVIMGRVVDDGSYDNGTPTPVGGVAAADLSITVDGNAAWYKKGPYFYFPNGAPSPGAAETSRERNAANKYIGGYFAYFVEVPAAGLPRDVTIAASSLAGGATIRNFGPAATKVFPGAFTWVTLREGGGGGQPPPPPPPPPPPGQGDFENEIYPLFLAVNEGGFGCHGCHTNQGGVTPAGGLNLYGGAAQAYAQLDPARYPTRVNLQSPSASLLLTKPLYEADGNQNHPIFAFVSTQEAAYRVIYDWISAGAVYDGQVVPVPPVSFYNDIRPLVYRPAAQGGLGCDGCHVTGVDANTAPGGLYFGGDGNALYNELTVEAATDGGGTGEPYRINKQGNTAASLLLTNPLIGSPEPHPGKLISNATDPNYQKIYRWITEGYTNDTP